VITVNKYGIDTRPSGTNYIYFILVTDVSRLRSVYPGSV
ncbi:unnamed protein product, partial [marine sediment metagenome]